ncbi:MAG: hypothetical protein J6J86_07015 [Lachnospiraceae bacterium]|nr:hypothetical protein [Lachnospiraceae bacterium]
MQDFDKIYAEYFSEAFFKALKNIDSFNGNCKLSTWLCKIAKKYLLQLCKK